MNKILHEKLVALPRFKVKLVHLRLPNDGVQKCLWDFYNAINFISPAQFWEKSDNHFLTTYPIYVSQKSVNEFDVIGGFRIFSLAKFLEVESAFAIDVSELSQEEQDEIAVHFTLFPLLLWATKTNHLDTDIKKFLKILFKTYPQTKKLTMKYETVGKTISRFKGRTQEKSKSKLSDLVAERMNNNER